MDVNRTTVAIRPRNHWEALDLGFHMARAWWRPLYASWFLVTLPCFAVLQLTTLGHPWASVLLFWWLKPLFERVPLYIVSHKLFGETPSAVDCLYAFPRLAKRQWLSWLTLRRLSPTRSMDMPVTQLEGLNGRQRQQRLALLHRRDHHAALWLTIIGAHLEAFFSLAVLALIFLMLPPNIELSYAEMLMEPLPMLEYLEAWSSYLAMSLMAPFYVAGGFAIYINRRIWLEGWDIEIRFRQLAERHRDATAGGRAPRGTASTVLALLLASALLWLSGAPDARAADADAAGAAKGPAQINEHPQLGNPPPPKALAKSMPLTRQQSRERMAEVLAGDDFYATEEVEQWRWKGEGSVNLEWLEWLFSNREAEPTRFTQLAQILELALWVSVAVLLAWLIARYRGWLARLVSPADARGRRPRVPAASRQPSPEASAALPDEPMREAERLWAAGHAREAVSVLYRSAIQRLIDDGRLPVVDGYTEQQCLQTARATLDSARYRRLAELTHCWQRLAYGHRPPTEAAFHQLCRDWGDSFRAEGGQSASA